MDRDSVVALYDRSMRLHPAPLPDGYRLEGWDGLVAMIGPSVTLHDNCVIYGQPDPAASDRAVEAAVERFAALGCSFEWKRYDHDDPAGALAASLRRRGFVPREPETFMALDLDAADLVPPAGLDIRRLDAPAQLADVLAIQDAVWAEDHRGLIDAIAAEWRQAPDRLSRYLAYVDGRPASTGWIRFHPGRLFADLWGGSTLAAHRGRGLYRGLVAVRAGEARRRGARYLTIDASPDSRPILARLGFEALDRITPYLWHNRS